MNKLFLFLATLSMSFSMAAANVPQTQEAKEFKARYDLIVSKLGPTGVGVETLLDKWGAAFPEDIDMLLGKFNYYFTKAQSTSVEKKDQDKFLGEKPFLTLKDSTGRNVNYFQEVFYDDELFGKAQKALDKAIQLSPDRLDMRFLKTAALVGYEKESPDMALSTLRGLVDYNGTHHPKWVYGDNEKADNEFFNAAIQEYCFLFFKYASPGSYEAFKSLSEKMLAYEPDNVLFLDNLGSYYLVVKKDDKTALKYYNKVLKLKPDDMTALKNLVILARNSKNEKLEKKYLPMIIKYTDVETDKVSAQARLDYLNKK